MPQETNSSEIPLVVDLDGTLIRTDSFYESLIIALRSNPLTFFSIPKWLLAGKAKCKEEISKIAKFDVDSLNYSPNFLDYLRQESLRGRRIILATGADQSIANSIAQDLGLFSDVIASDGKINRTGRNKLSAIKELLDNEDFAYAGNASVDISIWKEAKERIAVNTDSLLVEKLSSSMPFDKVFDSPPSYFKSFLKAIRVYQYSKNVLLFVPLIMAHQLDNPAKIFQLLVAFISFSACASSVYLINDMCDLEADKQHKTKCRRPFASGALPLTYGLVGAPALMLVGLFLGCLLGMSYLKILLLYLITTSAYSFYIKQIAIADVIVLALLYTLRLVAGGLAVDVPLSEWMRGFSIFFFLSMAFAKRHAELFRLRSSEQERTKRRGYFAHDLEQLSVFGSVSGYISVLVFALYINSPEVRTLYSNHDLLWLISPVLLYWISRIWILAHRGEMAEDPVVFATTDFTSYVTGAITALLLLLSK